MSGEKSRVLCHSSSVLLHMRDALESKRRQQLDICLAGWQQLFEQQDITVICTIHFHPCLHENHTSAPAPGDQLKPTHTVTQEYVYQKPVRDVNELKQHVIDTWSATSRASLIKRLINCFNACLKANSKH